MKFALGEHKQNSETSPAWRTVGILDITTNEANDLNRAMVLLPYRLWPITDKNTTKVTSELKDE